MNTQQAEGGEQHYSLHQYMCFRFSSLYSGKCLGCSTRPQESDQTFNKPGVILNDMDRSGW